MKFSIKDLFIKSDKIRSFLRIWSDLQNKYLNGKIKVLCSVYIFSFCHKQSSRESSLGFLSFPVSMVGVVCFILSCRTDETSQQYKKNKSKNGRPLGWTHLTSHIDIRIERKDCSKFLEISKGKLLELHSSVNTNT